jgi:hypothetical protein
MLPTKVDEMKKSTLIATFLTRLGGDVTIEHAERLVATTFAKEYPNSNFREWDTEINDDWCWSFLASAPRTLSKVNVGQFILDLWDKE